MCQTSIRGTNMTMGRFIGYPDVYPWDTIKVISLEIPTGGVSAEHDIFDEINGAPRGFILTDAMVLDCIPWGNPDQETYISVGFTAGNHFGTIRKIKTKGTSSNTSGTATTIAFFK